MKKIKKTAFLGALLASVALLAVWQLNHKEVNAAGLAVEKYKILSVMNISPSTLEGELNRLGAEGWKVRTAVGAVVILAK